MTYGYCRISTKKQNIERQERNIKATYPEALIRKEVYTGTKSDRKTQRQADWTEARGKVDHQKKHRCKERNSEALQGFQWHIERY